MESKSDVKVSSSMNLNINTMSKEEIGMLKNNTLRDIAMSIKDSNSSGVEHQNHNSGGGGGGEHTRS